VTIVRIGANKKYSDNWEKAFGKKAAVKQSAVATSPRKKAAKRSAKKAAKRK
jgi:hypothetical protein